MRHHKSIQALIFIFFFCIPTLLYKQAFGQGLTATKTKEGIEIYENEKKVLFYRQSPKSLDGKYERANYVHPLYSLNGNVLTEDFPEDHPYHRGIYWAWHQILLNNKPIADGWTCENISWIPIKEKIKNGKESIVLQSEVLWKVKIAQQITDIVRETTKITVHTSTNQYRAIDFDIHLFALLDSLKIGGSEDIKGYGGFCLRLKLPGDISFASQGKEVMPQDTAVTAGPWMNFNGSFDSENLPQTGIAVFRSPSNPGPQQKWILRKKESMQNTPYPGRTAMTLSRKGWRLAYRIIIHNGSTSVDDLEKLYQQYVRGL